MNFERDGFFIIDDNQPAIVSSSTGRMANRVVEQSAAEAEVQAM